VLAHHAAFCDIRNDDFTDDQPNFRRPRTDTRTSQQRQRTTVELQVIGDPAGCAPQARTSGMFCTCRLVMKDRTHSDLDFGAAKQVQSAMNWRNGILPRMGVNVAVRPAAQVIRQSRRGSTRGPCGSCRGRAVERTGDVDGIFGSIAGSGLCLGRSDGVDRNHLPDASYRSRQPKEGLGYVFSVVHWLCHCHGYINGTHSKGRCPRVAVGTVPSGRLRAVSTHTARKAKGERQKA